MALPASINPDILDFPDTRQALTEPNGLLAIGGDLSLPRLLCAYERGIFPWYQVPQPILWWSPDPRMVLFADELKVSRSLRRTLCRSEFRITADRDFQGVVAGCAAPRRGSGGSWISGAMATAYGNLHRAGYAHSVEVWDREGSLVGGLYGVALGQVFFGESMFSKQANASKMALMATLRILQQRRYAVMDCQLESAHLVSLGARAIPRLDFERYLAQTVGRKGPTPEWALSMAAGELL